MEMEITGSFCPANRQEWRRWLEKNHQSKQSVWLIFYKVKAGVPTITWSEAVDEALCFGWIDSTKKTIDDISFMQFFSRRKPKSMWSKINKNKVDKLIEQGLMTEAGFSSIEIAKQNGSWTILDTVEDLIIPEDLANAFEQVPSSKESFLSQSKSQKKLQLSTLAFAKTSATRQKRIAEIVAFSVKK